MPDGFETVEEAELDKAERIIEDRAVREGLFSWWIADVGRSRRVRTPCWDIASTCRVDGRRGLLLVEAKSHPGELHGEEKGKTPPGAGKRGAEASAASVANHERIGRCIREASDALGGATGFDWNLSRDSRYQLSNRFAWAWKVADAGIPVVLVYIGFLNCDEMATPKLSCFASEAEWKKAVFSHSAGTVPREAWNRSLDINGTPLIPVVESLCISLER